MSDTIAVTRRAIGWTQADLARRVGVTPAGVSHWETTEKNNRITLGTLDRALRAMRRRPAITAVPDTPPNLVTWNQSAAELAPRLPAQPRGTPRALFRARSRIRTGAIVADAYAERNQLPLAEAWTAAEGNTVATEHLRDWWHIAGIAADYDHAISRIANPRWTAAATTPTGLTVAQVEAVAGRSRHPVLDAIVWAATLVANQIPERQARYLANVAIVRSGFDWIALDLKDRDRLDRAIAMIEHGGDATSYIDLLLDRYDESD